jgi:hypothetical protein
MAEPAETVVLHPKEIEVYRAQSGSIFLRLECEGAAPLVIELPSEAIEMVGRYA